MKLGIFHEVIVKWPGNVAGFVLQSSPSLNPPRWTNVTDGLISPDGSDMKYDGPEANDKARFFRLKRN